MLYYLTGVVALLLLRYVAVQVVRRSTVARLIATKRVFIIGNAGEIERFLRRYQPSLGGAEVVGCRFLSEGAQMGPAPSGKRRCSASLEW